MAIREITLGPRSKMLDLGSGKVLEGAEPPIARPADPPPTRLAALVAATSQPAPTGNGTPVEPVLVELIRQRTELGREKYGTELRTRNGRDALVDALQESLDLNQYLMQRVLELQDDLARAEAELAAVRQNFEQARTDLGAEQAAVAQLQGELRRLRTAKG